MLYHCSFTEFPRINVTVAESKNLEAWQIAQIIPVYKKSYSSGSSNYRPMSLTSTLCKILEKCIETPLQAIDRLSVLPKKASGSYKVPCINPFAYLIFAIHYEGTITSIRYWHFLI
ncbi:unnamed protein product [Rhizopus microsporus]